jgi:hypothetical protein
MYHCFVLGNGKSRSIIDLNKLQNKGPVYGCNYIYLEFTPDVLVAYDEKMTYEIEKTGYPKENKFYSAYPNLKAGSLPLEDCSFSNSGACAIFLAAAHGFKTIYMLGIDLINNDNMSETLYNPVPFKKEPWFWDHFGFVYKRFSATKFVRVSDLENDLKEWKSFQNYFKITSKEFLTKFNCEKN